MVCREVTALHRRTQTTYGLCGQNVEFIASDLVVNLATIRL